MSRAAPPVEALAASSIAEKLLGSSLLAVYLHGSAASGRLRPQSDVDLLAIVDEPLTASLREALARALMRISALHPARPGGPRCVELTILLKSGLSAHPIRSEFVYGEWLRDAFEAGRIAGPGFDPDHTLTIARARDEAIAIMGPPAREMLPPVPREVVRRAMRETLPGLRDALAGDERNVLLTLARMWRSAAIGDFVAKDEAAEWAAALVPDGVAKPLLDARDAYRRGGGDDWRGREASLAADHLRRAIADLL